MRDFKTELEEKRLLVEDYLSRQFAEKAPYGVLLEAMRYICLCDPKKLFSFQVGVDTQRQLAELTEAYLCTQLERGFSTLDFYKSLLI